MLKFSGELSNVGLVRRDRDKNCHGGGMAGWNEKLRRDAGLKKPMLDPHNHSCFHFLTGFL